MCTAHMFSEWISHYCTKGVVKQETTAAVATERELILVQPPTRFLLRLSEDEPDNLAPFANGEDCLLPRLLLPRQLGHLHLLPCSLAAQGAACQRGRLLCGWIQEIPA